MKIEERRKLGTYVSLQFSLETRQMLLDWSKVNNIPHPLKLSQYHLTLIYSRTEIENVQALIDDAPFIEDWAIDPNGFQLFDAVDKARSDKRCLVITMKSPIMEAFNKLLVENGGTNSHPEYHPHVTLSYAAPHDLDISELVLPTFQLEAIEIHAMALDKNWVDT
jgi:hypothetical protein